MVWTTPINPVNKPVGQEWIGNPEALAEWGHLNPNGSRRHRMSVYTNEEQTDAAKLLQETWDYIQEASKPLLNVKLTVQDLEQVSQEEYKHEAVRIGDTVYCIIQNLNRLELEARILEMERDLLEPENTEVVIENVQFGFTDLVQSIQNQVGKKVSQGDPIGWLQGIIDAAQSEFHSKNGYVYITDKDGILITKEPWQ